MQHVHETSQPLIISAGCWDGWIVQPAPHTARFIHTHLAGCGCCLQVYIGAQADESLLEKVVADRAQHGLYDIIVDDGMHDPTMQMQTLTGLWPALESGGIYIMEDGEYSRG